MEEKYSVGIVIVNYNGASFQNDCVISLVKSDYKNIKIIVVDNKSMDNSMELLKEIKNDRIVPVYLDDNYGVAKGNNEGIKKSIELGCDFTLLLNNDTEVEPSFMTKLLEAYEDKCLFAPKMFYFFNPDILCYAGGVFNKSKAIVTHLHDTEKDEGIEYVKYCNYSPTTCLLVKNEDFKVIGVMDEKYFLYYDDVDFSYRASLNGYRIKFVPESVIYHKDGMTTKGKKSLMSIYYNSRNKLYFVSKYKFPLRTVLYTYITRYLKMTVLGSKEERKVIRQAYRDFKNKKMGKYIKKD